MDSRAACGGSTTTWCWMTGVMRSSFATGGVAGGTRSEMSMPAPTELHAHSCYSFLDGASQPDELAAARG